MSWPSLHSIALLTGALLSSAVSAQDFPSLARESLKDCDAVAARPLCRVKRSITDAEASQRLDGQGLRWWRENDTFSVLAVHRSDSLRMCCAIQAPMARLPGTDIWTLTVRIADLDKAVLDISPLRGGPTPYPPPEWRGPAAPVKRPLSAPLKGALVTETIMSRHLGAARGLTIYLPPDHRPGRRYPVIYAADGRGASAVAAAVEPLILTGRIPATMIVGVHAGNGERRALDYLRNAKAAGDGAFQQHEQFFLTEVMPLAEQRFGATTRPEERMLLGQSNGAAWALSTALRHPRDFGQAAVLSFGWPEGAKGMGGSVRPRLYFAAGTLEGIFLRRTREASQAAATAGHDVQLHVEVSGHSNALWQDQYASAAEWAFGAK